MTLHTKIAADRSFVIREGTAEDAAVLRRVFEEASHGLAQYFWDISLAGETDRDRAILDRMSRRIADPATRFRVCEICGVPAGGVLSYEKDETPEDPGDCGPLMRALIEAENDLTGTHYINALAVFPEFRRRGIARALIEDVAAGAWQPLSLIAADVNADALRLYDATGFETVRRHPMAKEGWDGAGEAWLSMTRRG